MYPEDLPAKPSRAVWRIPSFFFVMLLTGCTDIWTSLANEFPTEDTADREAAVRVQVFDYGNLRRFSLTPIDGYVDSDGVHLTTSEFRSVVSGDVLIPWTSISACGQTLWCPGRDTNFWLDDLRLEITFDDDDRELLRVCGDNGVPVLASGMYSSVKLGETPLDDALDIQTPKLSTPGCSDSSYP